MFASDGEKAKMSLPFLCKSKILTKRQNLTSLLHKEKQHKTFFFFLNASLSYMANTKSFLSSQICQKAQSVDHVRFHKHKQKILVKLDTGPSWM